MDRRTPRVSLRATLGAALVLALAPPAGAGALTTTDIIDWNLTESTSTWPSEFHIGSSGSGWAAFRWVDSPNKTTVISANSCIDLALFGQDSIGVGDTAYHNLFFGSASQCFRLRGRTASGSGSMVNHDGRVQR
jgi:hypothetical protein